ncbi:MAG: hypothetical protein KBT28_10270, partial [Bacteroidales bacterium]|nr:hypothetical protein [Candidatus Colimorpha merdihippi]
MTKYNFKGIALMALAILSIGSLSAQESFCKGLKNPTSFMISGSNPGNAQWYGFTGSRNSQASVCGTWGMANWGSQINASQLASQSSGSSCTNGNSVDINGQSDYMNRFVIKGSGTDPLTSNHLSYLPPDNSFTSSIRLGNNCGGTHEAEMLCYQLDVRPQNSLIFIWYALSLQNGQHPVADNPEFAIEIEKKVNATTWQRVGGDTLCYIRPTPAGSGSVAPFLRGATGQTGTGTYGENIYLPWNKVAINLNNYLYETIRIKIGAGDCSMSAHYACAYIAGECQPMEIKTSGCPAGATTTVQTLTAPTGLSNYVWYKADAGTEGISSLYAVSDDIAFTPLTSTTATNTNNVYECQIEDFRLTAGSMAGEFTNEQVFRCDMTSQMNEDIPFTSSVYVRVVNTKPLMAIDTLKNCDGQITLTNTSYVPHDLDGCDTSISKWYFYSGSNNNTTVLDSAIGAVVNFQWDSCGQYAVKVRSFNTDDHTCFSDSTYTVNVLCRPNPVMEVDPANKVCAADSVILHDATPGMVRHDWVIDDVIYPGPRSGNTNNDFGRVFTKYRTPVELVAYNGLFTRDSINTYDTIWCTSSAYDTIEVFQHPELL